MQMTVIVTNQSMCPMVHFTLQLESQIIRYLAI